MKIRLKICYNIVEFYTRKGVFSLMHDKNLIDVNLTSEMKTSFIDYAMSVIVARALPDVRDGLKPVQRRILYGMNELGVTPEKPHKKSARISGDVMGKYHPHGDSSIYEAMVRMAQWWSYRHMLVDGHGNFGSMDGDSPAAQRYTEARMSKIALEMLRDINKNTVDFQDNYDGSEREPLVLPARFPNLLVNGATGIAVGMATNIPPHNLGETIEAVKLVMDNSDVTVPELMKVLPGPDFPTGALIMGRTGIRKSYETGKGSMIMRSRTEIELTKNGRERIVVTEFPYGVNKQKVHKHIVRLAQEKRIDGITAVRDESSREGVRLIIEVRRDTSANVILNNLYKLTSLQTNFSFNMLAIENGVPRVLPLKRIIIDYIEHQKEVVVRRTEFDKAKAEKRAHILEGLLIALDHLDEVISIIRNSDTDTIAQRDLMDRFDLSERQSQAILDMRLRRLTGLEREKIQSEYDDLLKLIADLADILATPKRVMTIIKEELDEIKRKYANQRRTELMLEESISLKDEDLIEEESVFITLSNGGYIKRLAQDEFRSQKRGGRGIRGTGVNNDDFVCELISTTTHSYICFMTNKGRVYRLKGYDIPEYGRTAKGLPVVNLLKLEKGERIQATISQSKHNDNEHYLLFVTRNGIVKRIKESDINNVRQNGLRAISLSEGDEVVNVIRTNGRDDIMIATKEGYSVRFKETLIRIMGRTARGVRGILLRQGDEVVGSCRITDDQEVLVITENGYGKRTVATEYHTRVGRSGKGFKVSKITDKTGQLAGLATINGNEDIVVITDTGIIIRTSVADISRSSRATSGVKIMKLDQTSKIATFVLVDKED